ncbi:MAG TPA: hypothetical protein VMS22_08290 [Candidatus Eisenbacteria bacterium]|nr:hypothetical protein [Candidatus Eisenbacteria bacterium]
MVPTRDRSLALIPLLGALAGTFACAPRLAPPPSSVRRIAVLPPCDASGAPLAQGALVTSYGAPVEGLGAILAAAAREELAQDGLQVVDPGVLEASTGGRVPASPEAAAEIVAAAKLDATALFIRVRRWEFAYPTLRTNEIIASLDAMLVDPTTGKTVWEVRRPTKPVPLRSELIGSQADVVAAREVMRELFASIGRRASG